MKLYQTKPLSESINIEISDLESLKSHARQGLFDLSVNIGLILFRQMMEEEATEMAGPKGKHNPDRAAYRHGTEPTQIVLGGSKIKTDRVRVRSLDDNEMQFETLELFQNEDPLNEAQLERILCGVSTRKYERTLDFNNEDTTCASKSEVSRRFAKGMQASMDEFFARSLMESYPVMLIDRIHVGKSTVVVAMGINSGGHKQILGIQEGETENSEVVNKLFADLIDRGFDADEPRLYVIDGSKALYKAVKDTFGASAQIQRCQVHKKRNVLGHLPEPEQSTISIALTKAYKEFEYQDAMSALMRIHRNLEYMHPEAAKSLMEGLEETLTVHKLKVPAQLRRTISNTNVLESANSVCKGVINRISRFHSKETVIRHVAAGFMEAERGFRRIKGYKQIPLLQSALARATGVRNNTKKLASA
jgi:transposase-like protein